MRVVLGRLNEIRREGTKDEEGGPPEALALQVLKSLAGRQGRWVVQEASGLRPPSASIS